MDKGLLLVGPAGSGKTTALMNRYRELVAAGVRTEQILVLVADLGQVRVWEQELGLNISGPQEVFTYAGFIHRELRLYWAQMQPRLPAGRPAAEPVWVGIEAAHYLMRQLVQTAQAVGRLSQVVAGPQRLAVQLVSGLWSVAAANGIPAHELGQRLARAAGDPGGTLYRDVQEMVVQYHDWLMQARLFDDGLGLETYHRALLSDPTYVAGLPRRFRHLLVDDLDETAPLQHAFIRQVWTGLASVCLTFSQDGGHTQYRGARPRLAYATFAALCREEHLGRSHTGSELCDGLADALYRRIMGGRHARAPHNCRVDRIEATLRGEMADRVGEKAAALIRSGVRPGDIAVIAPQVDPVLLHALNAALTPVGVKAENPGRAHRVLDDPFVRAAVTLVALVHPEWGLVPGPVTLAATLGLLLQLDPIRTARLARAVAQGQGELPAPAGELQQRLDLPAGTAYSQLCGWVRLARGRREPVDKLVAAAGEYLMPLIRTPAELSGVGQFMRLARGMRTLADNVGQILQQPAGQCFMDMLLGDALPVGRAPQRPGVDLQVLPVATPAVWLASRRNVRWQIWVDVGGDLWYPGDARELTNPHVLSPEWPPGELWTDSRSLVVRRDNAARTVRALLRRCRDGLVLAESLLDSRGRELEGNLSQAVSDVTEGEGR